jgi:long-chain acyl-CoA synthetase
MTTPLSEGPPGASPASPHGRQPGERPWLRHYPEGTEAEVGEVPYRNLPEMLRACGERFGSEIAFTQCMPNGMNGSLRYDEVNRLSDAFAAYLREDVGLAPGDRVAVQMPNCLSYPVVAFGVLKAGCVLVNTNPLYTASEMIHQYADSGARALVIIDMFADRLPEVLPKTTIQTVITTRVGAFFPPVIAGVIRLVQRYWDRSIPKIEVEHTPLTDALDAGRKRMDGGADVRGYLAEVDRESLAALQYTGGTTGVSKGAMLSHGNLLLNMQQMLDIVGAHIRGGKEVVLTALPLYHIFAFTVNLLGFFEMGARNILIPSPRPPSNLKRAFENYRITWLTGVNTLFNALLNERWFTEYPPSHLQASAAGGMSLHASVAERWREVTNTPIVEGYGLTESSPVLSFNPLGGVIKDGSIGLPVPSTDMRCVDDSGQPLPAGEAGEIVARGPQIMQGYWQRDDDTRRTIRDGWLHTGDVGKMDEDGYFYIVDRKKDMILVSGFNVYPNEVEEVIAAHPAVEEVAVIGVPDERSGEAVRAYVVAKEPGASGDEIIAHTRQHLAAYKVPRSVEFREELPKSLIGKILRKDLRAELPDEQFGITPESVTGTHKK